MSQNATFDSLELYVSCPRGLQYVLEDELKELGFAKTKAIPGGVECQGDLAAVYRTLLWSRVANRVQLILSKAKIETAEDLYDLSASIDWTKHFAETDTFAVNFWGTNKLISNTTFGALKIKDAIVDQFRSKLDQRPDVDKVQPNILVSARLAKGIVSISLDVSGESLHKRGYRLDTGMAPLKENLAAGILKQARWPKDFSNESGLIDPMCGSGTFLIEGAMIALDMAPNLNRTAWGFDYWKGHKPSLWRAMVKEAQERFLKGCENYRGRIVGFDHDAKVVGRAWQNVERAGLKEFIHIEKRAIQDFSVFDGCKQGLLVCNPPYGERLGEMKELETLYLQLGDVLQADLGGWRAAIFTSNEQLSRKIGWRSYKQYKLMNGGLEALLALFDCQPQNRYKSEWLSPEELLSQPSRWRISNDERAQMFRNRLKKNAKNLSRWLKRESIASYRLYDADMPEFAVAIDLYQTLNKERFLHVQEYAPPKSVNSKAALERLSEALFIIKESLDIAPERIFLKRREIQKGHSQYEKQDKAREFFVVEEADAKLRVNFQDYLDTGLFLDHRPIRRWVRAHAKGKRVLNLFCYTASVSVHAALGGATSSLSIDMSSTYLDWGAKNYKLNHMNKDQHRFERADCTAWLKASSEAIKTGEEKPRFDLIFIDPPSFSNSKRMDGIFDVQRDHYAMLNQAMDLLTKEGVLVFSNNFRKFQLDERLCSEFVVKNITRDTFDPDFIRRGNIHQCYLLTQKVKVEN